MQSPFTQYLGTNYVPSDSELESIRLHLRPYKLEAARLETLIRDLTAQRDRLFDYINPHRALISPVRRLPPDILQEIFLACLPAEHNAVMSVAQPPLIFGHICSGWRTLALSTAALWTSVHIPLDYIFDRHIPDAPMTWLGRSGDAPISLSIVGANNMGRWVERSDLETLLHTLAGSAHHWESLDLTFRHDEGMLLLKDVAAPNLVALKIDADPGQIAQMKLLAAPSLRAVTICIGFGIMEESISRFLLPWNHLTFVKLSCKGAQGMSPSFALALLAKCSSIVHFEADVLSFPEDNPPRSLQSSVSLPALRVLIFPDRWDVGENSITYLLRHLLMPSLRTLHLPPALLTLATISAQRAPFLGDLLASSPLIEDLGIDLSGLAQASFLSALRALPGLKKLTVLERCAPRPGGPQATPITARQLVASLTPGNTPPSICPILEELHIKKCVSIRRDADLLEFAQRRLDHGGGCFRLLVVKHKRLLLGDVTAPEILESFRERGITLQITRPGVVWNGQRFSPWTGIENGE